MKKQLLFIISCCISAVMLGQISISNNGQSLLAPTVVDSTTTIELTITSDIIQDVNITGIEEPFSISSEVLYFTEVGQSISFTISLNPSTPGNYSNLLSASGTIFGALEILIEGEGTLVEVTTSADTLYFGEVPITQTSVQCLNISNVGSGTMLVGDIQSTSPYLTSSETNFSLAQDSTNGVCFTFEATLAGDWEETLTIYSSDPNNGSHEIVCVGTSISEIGGEVSGTLGAINSPYYVVEDLLVPDGLILSIEPGVEIFVQNNSNITVEGSLYATGSIDDSIYFYNVNHLIFNEADNTVSFDYCNLSKQEVNEEGNYTYVYEDMQDGNWDDIMEYNTCFNSFSLNNNASWFRDTDDATTDNYMYTYQSDASCGTNGTYWYTPFYSVVNEQSYVNLDFDYFVERSESRTRYLIYVEVNSGGWELFKDMGSWYNGKEFHISYQMNGLNEGDEFRFKFESYVSSTDGYKNQHYAHFDNFHIYGTSTLNEEGYFSSNDNDNLNTVKNPDNQFYNVLAYEQANNMSAYEMWAPESENSDYYYHYDNSSSPNYQYADYQYNINYDWTLGYSSTTWRYNESKMYYLRDSITQLKFEIDFIQWNDWGSDQMKFYYRTSDIGWTQIFYKNTEEYTSTSFWTEYESELISSDLGMGDYVQFKIDFYQYGAEFDNFKISTYNLPESDGLQHLVINSGEFKDMSLSASSLLIENSESNLDFVSYNSPLDFENVNLSNTTDQLWLSDDSEQNYNFDNVTSDNANSFLTYNNQANTNSQISIENSRFNNLNTVMNIEASTSSIVIENCIINNSGSINLSGDNLNLAVNESSISNSTSNAINSIGSDNSIGLVHTVLSDSESSAIYASGSNNDITLSNSVISNNGAYGLYASRNNFIDHSTIFGNGNYGVYTGVQGMSYLKNSVVALNNNSYNSQINSNIEVFYSLTSGNPYFADEDGRLETFSEAVDAAMPWEVDAHMPSGLGSIRADMGAYGGPNNAYWGGDAVPNGSPTITAVTDIPNDQGGLVGIEFDASVFDGTHPAYNVTHYSFWREMNLDGERKASVYLYPENITLSNEERADDGNWEHVGEMTSNDFNAYGFSASTLADSVSGNVYPNTYVVIAHTEDQEVYWYSDTLSGYSIDNLAPNAPQELRSNMNFTSTHISWEAPTEIDYDFSNIYRDSILVGSTNNVSFEDSTIEHMVEYDYVISHVDVHGNASDTSSTSVLASIAPWVHYHSDLIHNVEFPSDLFTEMNGEGIQVGDYVGAFIEIDGVLVCISQVMWIGDDTLIELYLSENYLGETVLWKLYDASNNTIYLAEATYSVEFPQNSTMFVSGSSQILEFNIDRTQTIHVNEGWSMISSNVLLAGESIETVMSDISNSIFVVKNDQGDVYWPEWSLNTIGSWKTGAAYLIKSSIASELEVIGQPLLPEITPIHLNEGWNMMAYLPNLPSNTEQALEDIVDNVIIVKDADGNVYWPEYNLNSIGLLEPGKGYQLKVTSDLTFSYPKVDEEERLNLQPNPILHHYTAPKNTGSNMTLLIPNSAWVEEPNLGDEIVAYDANFNVISSVVYSGSNQVLTLWGDDSTTDVKEALATGESFYLNLWHKETNTTSKLDVYSYSQGSGLYSENDIQIISSIGNGFELRTGTLQLKALIPNPSAGSISIALTNPIDQKLEIEIYNQLGQIVFHTESVNYVAGNQSILIEPSHLESGSYFVKVLSNNDLDVLPLQIIK